MLSSPLPHLGFVLNVCFRVLFRLRVSLDFFFGFRVRKIDFSIKHCVGT